MNPIPVARWKCFPSVSGVYRITCVATGDTYVGGTRNFRRRMNVHVTKLRAGTHTHRMLSLCMAHGVGSFVADILERCAPDQLEARETHWIVALRPPINFSFHGARQAFYEAIAAGQADPSPVPATA